MRKMFLSWLEDEGGCSERGVWMWLHVLRLVRNEYFEECFGEEALKRLEVVAYLWR